MRIFMSVLMAMLVFAGSACMENKDVKLGSGNSQTPEIEARQTDMMPPANTYYRLYPNDIYKKDPRHPGPASVKTSIAWDMANEFVYRTALRRLCQLPAYAAGAEDGGYTVSFERIGGSGDLKIFVTDDFKAVKWLEPSSAKE
jgi:hypothetical protein